MNIESAAEQFDALGHSTRLTLFRMLLAAGDEGRPVGRLQEELGVPASTLSHHVKRLVEVGLASQERRGTTLVCRVDRSKVLLLLAYVLDRAVQEIES